MTNETTNKAPASPRETIVIMQPDTGLRASAGRLETKRKEPVSDIEKVLKKYKANIVPMFGITEERVEQEMMTESAEADIVMPELSVFYKLEVDDEHAEEAAEAMGKLNQVEAAYVKPGAEPPVMLDDSAVPMQDEPTAPVTPDFMSRQSYLNASPVGVDAHWANARAGGRGQNVRIIDIEGAWRFSHEDLRQMQGGVVVGTPSTDIGWRNHGTAVLGVYSGDHNRFGISGICDNAMASAISIFGGIGSANAIRHATKRLRSGDVILLELHRPGPRHNFQSRGDQKGYIAIEWWEDDYAAILAATRRGIIVVQAAGNGAENLDDDIYQVRPSNFPSSWSNSFRRSNRDSGAIVVGAGAPPPGTHGNNHGPDRSRLDFSNYGKLVDAQGWGREVTTCGYGDLQGGHEDVWYTDRFSGTSSASPIVVGAIASLQGMVRARGLAVLSPAKVRKCLRATGAAQADAPGRPLTQRIGNRPDIKALYKCAVGIKPDPSPKECKELKEFKERKDSIKEVKVKERKERFKERGKEFIREKNFDKQLEKQREVELTPQGNGLESQPDLNELKQEIDKKREIKRFKEKDKEFSKEIKEKDHKEFKELSKEIKDKDKERKEFIKEKDKERKEFKEKEFKELSKEIKEKDRKDFKEKDVFEGKPFENEQFENWRQNRPTSQGDGLESQLDPELTETFDRLEFKHDKDIMRVIAKHEWLRKIDRKVNKVIDDRYDQFTQDDRLASLETMVDELTHFITSELRPDLVQGAQDYAGQQDDNDPGIAAQIAKDEKDVKDNETF